MKAVSADMQDMGVGSGAMGVKAPRIARAVSRVSAGQQVQDMVSTTLSGHLPCVCLVVYMSVSAPACLRACVCVCVCVSVCLFVCLSTGACVCQSICVCACVSTTVRHERSPATDGAVFLL